ncbi:MAG: glycosyltransferase family 4 protein [Bdellovibrionota bacterium]
MNTDLKVLMLQLPQGQELRILATSYDYRPRLGGIATFSYEVVHALREIPGVRVKLIAPIVKGWNEEEKDTLRLDLPSEAMQSIVPISIAVSREIISFSPHVILHFLWHPCGAASLLNSPLRWATHVPYFVFAYGVEILESPSTWKKWLRSKLIGLKQSVFRQAAGVFSISKFTGAQLESACRVEPSQIHPVYCGVSPEKFYPEPASARIIEQYQLHGRRVLLTVSRLQDYKGIDRMLSALRAVIKKHPDVVYLICGTGPDRSRLEALSLHYRVASHVIFTGPVSGDNLRELYNSSEVFVLLSRTDWYAPNVEGFGLVYLEAAACGKPAIGSSHGGVPDAIEDGVSGWIVDPTNDDEIASTVINVLDHPEEIRKRGENARERALRSFTWQHVAQRVLTPILKKGGHRVRN